jgi:hypothetical protein
MRSLLLLSIALAGCVGTKPMPLPDGGSGYALQCPDQASCYRKAAKVCGGKYEVLNESTGFLGADYQMGVRCQ